MISRSVRERSANTRSTARRVKAAKVPLLRSNADGMAGERTRSRPELSPASRQVPDGWQLRGLLSARRERPYDRRAAEQCDELAPPDHSITSSASKRANWSPPSPFLLLGSTWRQGPP